MILNAIPGVAQAKGLWAVAKGWVLLGVALAIFSAGIYSGHRWESGETQKALRKMDQAQNATTAWKASSQGWELAAGAWQKRFDADEATRREFARQAQATLDKLAQLQSEAEARQAKWQSDFDKAKQNPNCAELLKETTCSVFSGY